MVLLIIHTSSQSSSFTPEYISEKNKNANTNSKKSAHPVFIAALFTIAKVWKQTKCPSTDEWM